MLNRKASNYLFYGIIVAILAVIFLIRVTTVGALDSRIETLKRDNILLQAQIDALEVTVEENQNAQIDQLYELYNQVPSYYSQAELTYFTVAQLEILGIDESNSVQRTVTIDRTLTFAPDSTFDTLRDDFEIVGVEVYFNTMTTDVIDDFIDLLYNADQVFIVNNIEYVVPDGENYIGVTIGFLAFYENEDAS